MDIKTKQHYFVGLDVHLRLTAICILDANCKIVKEEIVKGHSPEVCKFLRENINGSFDVVFEACDGYGFWYEKLSRIARRVLVAHPTHLRNIWNTKKKTDRIDAQKLAKLLGLDLIPPVYVPKIDVRDWRTLIRHRQGLVQKRTCIKNKLRAILRRNHVPAPRNLWSKKNQLWLSGVKLYAEGETLQRDMLLEDLAHCDKQIARVEVELDKRAKKSPGVSVIKTIPGVANRTAEAIVAWIDDVSRFGRSKQIGAYFGFAVSEDSSGGRQKLGHISHQGPSVVRHLLVQAVHRMARLNPTVRSWVERFQCGQDKRKQVAIVAAAHKLSRCMFAMLQSGEVWNPAA